MYRQTTIKGILEQINSSEIYLPAFQRKFVWKEKQITKLFDSILRGYPMGTFLFWRLRQEHANANIFYRFIQNYSEYNNYQNQLAAFPVLMTSIYGVLDGQQRLSALYMALQGSYASKIPHRLRDNPAAYPVRQLYLNLMAIEEHQNDNETPYEFRFLTDNDAQIVDTQNLWYKVKDLLPLNTIGDVTNIYQRMLPRVRQANIQTEFDERWSVVFRILSNLYSYLTMKEYICFYEVDTPYIDDVLSIFVRINSAGTILEKTDLLFSTIVANWQNGREQIETFLGEINAMGNGFKFRIDFFMRSCLCLSDLEVLFKVDNFTANNLNTIKDNFMNITGAIRQAVNVLVRLGFSSETLISQNIVIPIAYYLKNGGQIDVHVLNEIKQYMHRALLKNLFGSHGDTLLKNIRTTLQQNNNIFSVSSINGSLPSDKTLTIDLNDINEMLTYKKGKDAFLVLSLLYPDLQFNQVVFHQDHIHPASSFQNTNYNQLALANPQKETYNLYRDMVPNLQLLDGAANQVKSSTAFDQWINQKTLNERDQFLNENYIDLNWDRSFGSFEAFFNNRKTLLRSRLMQIFNIQDLPPDLPHDENTHVNGPFGGVLPITMPPLQENDFEDDEIEDEQDESGILDASLNLTEKDKLKQLNVALIASEFRFIDRGTYRTEYIYNAVKEKYPDLCNDNYLCSENCEKGNNQAEWKHKVRGCLNSMKDESQYIRKNPELGYWDLI